MSNTGCTSVGVLLMTRRISAGRRLLLQGLGQIAVSRVQLLEEADVLDGDDGLIGEGPQELDVSGRERAHPSVDVAAADPDGSDGVPLPEHRDRQDVPIAHRSGEPSRRQGDLGVVLDVRHVNDRPIEDRSGDHAVPTGSQRIHAPEQVGSLGRDALVMGDDVDQVAIEPEDRREHATTQPHHALDDGVEDRLDVGGRARDDPEDLAGRGLLLEGFGEVAVARLELREEADVLDGDDGLIGEGLQERDLLVRERPRRSCARR